MKASTEWKRDTAAWKRLLRDELVIHCSLWHAPLAFHFLTEIFFEDTGNIYRSVFRRILGKTVEVPTSRLELYDAPLDFFLDDLIEKRFHAPETRRVHVSYWMAAVPHRACFNPYGSNDNFLLPPEHHLLLANYGAILESIVLRARENHTDCPWKILRERFGAFLYQQEVKVLRMTNGEVANM